MILLLLSVALADTTACTNGGDLSIAGSGGAKAQRVSVALPERPPSRFRIEFDRTDAPGHRALEWDPGDEMPLIRAVSLPAGCWHVSANAEPFPFGTAGSQPLDYAWGAALSSDKPPRDTTYDDWGRAFQLNLQRTVGTGLVDGAMAEVRRPITVRVTAGALPSIGASAAALGKGGGGSAPSGSLPRRAFGIDAAAVATQLLESAGEVVVERAQVEGLEAVREQLQSFTCDKLVFDAKDGDLPPELAEVIARYRPGGSENEHKPLLARTCVAVKSMRINQLASAGELLLRSLLQDTMQLGGLVIVDQLVQASGNNALVGVLRDPLLSVVELGVDAVSAEGISDTDAQRVLVSLAQSVSRPLTDPAVWAEAALPPMLDTLYGPAPSATSVREAVETLRSGADPSADAVLGRWLIRTAGKRLVLGILAEPSGEPAALPSEEQGILREILTILPTGRPPNCGSGGACSSVLDAARLLVTEINSADASRKVVASALADFVASLAPNASDPGLSVILGHLKDTAGVVDALTPMAREVAKSAPFPDKVQTAVSGVEAAFRGVVAAEERLAQAKLELNTAEKVCTAIQKAVQKQDCSETKEVQTAKVRKEDVLREVQSAYEDLESRTATLSDLVNGLDPDPWQLKAGVQPLVGLVEDAKSDASTGELAKDQLGKLAAGVAALRPVPDPAVIGTAFAALSKEISRASGQSATSLDGALTGQCAAGTVLAVVAECQALGGCDARDLGDMLAHPEETFDLALCSTAGVDLEQVYLRWGRAEDFAASALDILTPPRNADPQSQAVSVTNLVLDLVDLVIVVEGMREVPPDWVGSLAEVTPIARTVFADALAGDAKGAMTTMITFVGDHARGWLGKANAAGPKKASAIARRAEVISSIRRWAPLKDDDPEWRTKAGALGDAYDTLCTLDAKCSDAMRERIALLQAAGLPPEVFEEPLKDLRGKLDDLAKAHPKQKSTKKWQDADTSYRKVDLKAPEWRASIATFAAAYDQMCEGQKARCGCSKAVLQQLTRMKAVAQGNGAAIVAAAALAGELDGVEGRDAMDALQDNTTHLLQRAVAFGVFASDFAVASQITDVAARKNAQKEAIRALTRATTDRSRSRGRWVVSLGGPVGPAVGLRGGGSADDDEALRNEKGQATDLGGLPVHLGLGFALDQVPTAKTKLGFHLDATPVELGRLIDWSKDGEQTIAVAYPSDAIRFGLTPALAFGRPNVPMLLGVHGWLDPHFNTDMQAGEWSYGAYLFFGFYVPLFDFN